MRQLMTSTPFGGFLLRKFLQKRETKVNFSRYVTSFTNSYLITTQGGYSQNFLRKFVKVFVTLGLNILIFKTKSAFLKQISLEVDITYIMSI